MRKKKSHTAPHTVKPKHHIFTNKYLNQIFCATPKDTRDFIDRAFRTYLEADANLLSERDYRIHVASFVAGVMETAFEMGWKEAIRNVQFTTDDKPRAIKLA